MARTKSDKKTYPVKLTLTESLYNELCDRAARQGITTAAWITFVIGEKLAALKRSEENSDKLAQEIMEQFSQSAFSKLLELYNSEEIEKKIIDASSDSIESFIRSIRD